MFVCLCVCWFAMGIITLQISLSLSLTHISCFSLSSFSLSVHYSPQALKSALSFHFSVSLSDFDALTLCAQLQ